MPKRRFPSAGSLALIVAAAVAAIMFGLGLWLFRWEVGGALFSALITGTLLAVVLSILFGMVEEIAKSRR